jgi:hypothetical protein
MIELPWVIPALVIIEMTDEDLDNLDAVADADRYEPYGTKDMKGEAA